MPIEKTYDAAATETRLYALWEQSGAFACNPAATAKPWCLMMPPPNVTGSLHMGHGLTFTLQDVLVRFQRMRGRDALWQPGTDHAGIATQMVVERELAKSVSNIGRREMGREAFLKKVWAWKEESGGTITRQLRRLGASPDWKRERFTMDADLNRAVNKVFVQLFNEGLIYKDTRLVNWDPKLLTAVSDLEVEQKEVKGNLWYFKYPVEGESEFITIATTRPETMLGDAAVAVHPENAKFKHLIGKFVTLPLVGRRIPIIGDEYADPEKGTGAVKITPAHDFNDFNVGKRHKLPVFNILDQHAKLNNEVPELYRGLDRFEARKRIVAAMEELDLLDKIEPHLHTVPHGDRSGVVIEPWLSEQWYCNAGELAKDAIKAVEEGRTKFVPQQWENTYYAWMRNIEPWCISRQLWWGHQIPAWYGPDGKYFVAETEDDAQSQAAKHYGKPVALKRDDDVLDTWFSSALWPFSTLGWPDKTPELERYYPTDVLVTGFDIIFFWVARMMMMGLYFMKDVPFRTVYIHALVRDEKGQKMSKTKGNVIDPLDMIDKYGTDALRFTLANMSTPGRDIKLAPARIEGNRNFATKLWNAARYCQMNECGWRSDFDPAQVRHKVNKWIIGETKLAADRIAALLEEYRFDLSSAAVYDFVWNNFCDWYLEFTKPILLGADEAAKAETRACTAWVLAQMLKMLHPFMPYITEELWAQIVGHASEPVGQASPTLPQPLPQGEGSLRGIPEQNSSPLAGEVRWGGAPQAGTSGHASEPVGQASPPLPQPLPQGEGSLLMSTAWPILPETSIDEAAKSEISWVQNLVNDARSSTASLNVVAGTPLSLQLTKGAGALATSLVKTYEAFIKKSLFLVDISIVDEVPQRFIPLVIGDDTVYLVFIDETDIQRVLPFIDERIIRFERELTNFNKRLGDQNFIMRADPEAVEEARKNKAARETMLAKLEAAKKSLAG